MGSALAGALRWQGLSAGKVAEIVIFQSLLGGRCWRSVLVACA